MIFEAFENVMVAKDGDKETTLRMSSFWPGIRRGLR